MKVIFTDNVTGVASRGEVRNVKGGYFRNYLLPYKKAMAATEQLLKSWEDKRKKILIEKENLRNQLEEIKRRLGEKKLKIEKKVTKKGTLYGGVKAPDIIKEIKAQFNVEIPAGAVKLEKEIKAVGLYEVALDFGDNIKTTLPLEVVAKESKE